MRTFHASPHAFNRALLQPMLSFLDMRQGAGIGLARIWSSLKAAQAIGNDGGISDIVLAPGNDEAAFEPYVTDGNWSLS